MYYNNRRLVLSIFWAVLGLVLISLSVAEILDSSLYAGMGGGLMAVGILQASRNLRYRKDAAYREKVDLTVSDERMRFLREKSWAWTGYFVVLIEGAGVVIAMVTGHREVQLLLSYSICLIIGVFLVCYMVLSRKY